MRFFAIRDSNDVEKNLANQVTDYVWNIWQKDNRSEVKSRYSFTEAKPKFLLTSPNPQNIVTDVLHIVPPVVGGTVPVFEVPIQDIMDVLDTNEALFVISPGVSGTDTWVELHRKLTIATIDKSSGNFLHYRDGTQVHEDDATIALFMAIFKMGNLPIYVAITNSDFLENKCWDDFKGTDIQYISVLKESRSVKDEIFSPAYRNGFVTQVGKHEMFVCGNEFSIEMFGEYLVEIPSVSQAIYEDSMVYPYKNAFDMSEHIKVYSNWPATVDEIGIVRVDMSKVPVGSTGFLRVEVEGGEFFKYWIYKTHRSIYEYVLHKTDPMPLENQGSIRSKGFY